MEYRHLGRTGLRVSPLCLGTMNFGPQTSEEDSYQVMDRALEHGLNFFDTADVYGWQTGEGVTEQIVGRWFAQGGERRERVVLATKVYGDMGKGSLEKWPNTQRLSALHIKRACESSLKRLQTDYIDLYQMHHVWRPAPWEEIWQAMEQLVREGKVLYVGSSNFAGWHVVEANWHAKQRNFLGLVSEQCKYHLRARNVEAELLPACEKYGLGVIPWSPLDGGALAGIVKGGSSGRRKQEWVDKLMAQGGDQLRAWEDLCDQLGHPPAEVAIAWLLTRKEVTAPIIGPRTLEQLDQMVGSLEVKLSAETLEKIDEIFPGPGAPAPECYAW